MKKIMISIILLLVLWGCDNDPELTTNIDTASVSGTLSLEQASVDTIAVFVKMVHQLDDGIWQEVEPDSSGFFLLEGLTPGEYDFSIAIDSRHYPDYFDELTLYKDKKENLETISLARIENNFSIVGQVSFDNQELIADVTIDIYYINKADAYVFERTISADSTGFFYEDGLFPGKHRLDFKTEHYPVHTETITLPDPELDSIDVLFEEIALIPYQTINVDGDFSDWGEPLYDNTHASNWSALNEYEGLYLSYDESNLYLGLEVTCESQNSINLYLDIDYGENTGINNFNLINQTIANGRLKKEVTAPLSFGADAALCGWDGTNYTVFNLENNNELNTTIVRENPYLEVAIPLVDLYENGIIPYNCTISIVALIGGGDPNSMSNDTIPQQSEDFGTDGNRHFETIFKAAFSQIGRK